MIFSSLLISSSSLPLPMYSVTFLVLRSLSAPPSEPPSPPSPPEPPDPPDPQIHPSSGEDYAQPLLLPHFTGLPRVHSEYKLPSPPPSRLVPPIITVFVPRRSSRRCCRVPITTRSPKVNLRLIRYIIWNGLGYYSRFVSTPLLWLSDYQFRVQAPSIVPTAILPSVPPGSLVVVIYYLALAGNSWDWLGLVQPCVSSSDMYVAFPCAPNVVDTSWAGFVMICVCTKIQTGSLSNGQPWPSWALSIYMTSEGPRRSVGILCVVIGLCAGLGFTEENICVIKSQLIQPPSQKIEVFLNFSDVAWLQCGLGWSFKDPLNGKIQHGSFSRPFVSFVLVAEALALKTAITAALALGVSKLACISDCQELVLLPNTGGHANELDGIVADCNLFRSMFMFMYVLFVSRAENCGADAVA
ncbi:uncharacterized protein LOC9306145 [Arabidopsis lyrata subsp. lyrata]|uniref:uncharacterized protein LOC9306145 n=1 Tax=Arabidopsis lyrata subsp. lyrata TaxID=81972 RepID=UPI000A29AFF0|nr:uncharacterized protein LOC9306145 [Arabidopsis lyrata subsp. lyrata]|eukprot:XP_020872245.1 uncharacterized protein LOC9306145 [Arabidopsis lyrata subsp. lyrata]